MTTTSTGPTGQDTDPQREAVLIKQLRDLKAQERSVEDQLIEVQSQGGHQVEKPNGAAVATIVAAGFGVAMLGLFTTLAEASGGIKHWLDFYSPAGPLSGKTTMAGVVWLGVWLPGVVLLRNREMNMRRAAVLTMGLILLGTLLTFPPFFRLFAAG